MIGLSVRSVDYAIAAGDIPAARIGGRVVVLIKDLEAYLAARVARRVATPSTSEGSTTT